MLPQENDGCPIPVDFMFQGFSICSRCYLYCPQRSCGKVMFHRRLSFCSQGGGGLADTPQIDTPPGQTPPVYAGIHTHPCPVHAGIHPPQTQCMLGYSPPPRRPLQRTVRILLECIFVGSKVYTRNVHCWSCWDSVIIGIHKNDPSHWTV